MSSKKRVISHDPKTLKLFAKTHDRLLENGKKGETFDTIINNSLDAQKELMHYKKFITILDERFENLTHITNEEWKVTKKVFKIE